MYSIFVDDTEADRTLVKRCLEAAGFGPVETYASYDDFADAIEEIKRGDRTRPVVVMLDMQIEDDDECGLKMLKISRLSIPETPAIILSMAVHRTLVESSYRGGASSYIPKDVDEEQFELRLKEVSRYWKNVARTS